MMCRAGGALAITLAALLVCCSADPHQEQDVSGDSGGLKARSAEGASLVRQVRQSRYARLMPYLHSRQSYYKRDQNDRDQTTTTRGGEWPFDEIDNSLFPIGSRRAMESRRDQNDRDQTTTTRGGEWPFDEIDNSGLDQFIPVSRRGHFI